MGNVLRWFWLISLFVLVIGHCAFAQEGELFQVVDFLPGEGSTVSEYLEEVRFTFSCSVDQVVCKWVFPYLFCLLESGILATSAEKLEAKTQLQEPRSYFLDNLPDALPEPLKEQFEYENPKNQRENDQKDQ